MNPGKRLVMLAAVAFGLHLSACTQWQYNLGVPLDSRVRESLTEGTALSTVLAQLGPPQRISSSVSGYVMAWEFWRVRENNLGISLGALGVDLFSLDVGQAGVAGQFLVLTFDRSHCLSGAAYAQRNENSDLGGAVQPFVGFTQVVDIDDLVGVMSQHGWGSALLEPLPRALNSQSRPDMGNTGIQQRGTPTAVGQESLEMQ